MEDLDDQHKGAGPLHPMVREKEGCCCLPKFGEAHQRPSIPLGADRGFPLTHGLKALVLQRIQGQFLAPRRQLIIVCNPSARGSDTLF